MSSQRAKVLVHGAVQGVGFRPFVHRLALQLGLGGSVMNSNAGVEIEVEGEHHLLENFMKRLSRERPPQARIASIERSALKPRHQNNFEIIGSSSTGAKSAAILPDTATCTDCLREIMDPRDRRYRYPFTNCTNCGPRFSIIESLPYDRKNTSMKRFTMCAVCEAEYKDINGRRYHAQPNACPECGPRLELWTPSGGLLAQADAALVRASEALRAGLIVAQKGIGGFQLLVDARNGLAVQNLRERKQRPHKPFAVMFPGIEEVEICCHVSELERTLLLSAEAPIVILQRSTEAVVEAVAPGNPRLGVMVPYSPLHHLLMSELGFPVVATSGNVSDEPICIDEREALQRLNGIADIFLVHDRPIVRHVDDSIVQVVMNRESLLRRARGYAPLPVNVGAAGDTVLAVGGHLKNTVALGIGTEVFLSQHIGNLETEAAMLAFRASAEDLPTLYDARPAAIACDLHPDYFSTQFARGSGTRSIPVQHHYAHILSCMAENAVEPPVLGVAWDGTGYGVDGSIWGGEFLLVSDSGFERVAHLRQFRLPGGDACMKDGRRSAAGVLFEIFGPDMVATRDARFSELEFTEAERRLLVRMLEQNLNAPVSSSAGRLFDAVAALIGLAAKSTFEGQAAMALEYAVDSSVRESYPFDLRGAGTPLILDWEPALRAILRDLARNVWRGAMAARFHNGLVEAILAVAERYPKMPIALSGGCLQNKYLLEETIRRLQACGREVYWHHQVPANDGGLALGQVIAARRALKGLLEGNGGEELEPTELELAANQPSSDVPATTASLMPAT
jgi:hydrogenase maturation protein HypF